MDWIYFESFKEPRRNQWVYVEEGAEVIKAQYRKFKDVKGVHYGKLYKENGTSVSPLPERYATTYIVY